MHVLIDINYQPRVHSTCNGTEFLKNSLWYSIIADEATDVSHNEQMSLSIRWTDDSYQIHEETIGLVQLPDTKAQTIYSVIKGILIRCSLPLMGCRLCKNYRNFELNILQIFTYIH